MINPADPALWYQAGVLPVADPETLKRIEAYRERVGAAARTAGPLLVSIFCKECGRRREEILVGQVKMTPMGPLFKGQRWPSTRRDYRGTDKPVFQCVLLDREQASLLKLTLQRWPSEYFLPAVECRRHGRATVNTSELHQLVAASATFGRTQTLVVQCHRDTLSQFHESPSDVR